MEPSQLHEEIELTRPTHPDPEGQNGSVSPAHQADDEVENVNTQSVCQKETSEVQAWPGTSHNDSTTGEVVEPTRGRLPNDDSEVVVDSHQQLAETGEVGDSSEDVGDTKSGDKELEVNDSTKEDGIVMDTPSPLPPHGILKHSSIITGETAAEETGSTDRKRMAPKRKGIPAWKLFRYADCWDILMIIAGAAMALAAGTVLQIHVLLFGEIINNFVSYSTAANLTQFSSNSTVLSSTNCTSALLDLGQNPAFVSQFFGTNSSHFCLERNDDSAQDVFSNVLSYICDPSSTLRAEIGNFSLYYIGLACGQFITLYFATMFWNVSAFRQTRRMRNTFYRSVLRQEVGWFDVNNAAELSTSLADGIERIQAGIGEKVPFFLESISSFTTGFIIAFTVSWKMTLVMAAMLPLLVVIAALTAKVLSTFAVKERSAYASAGAVAEEVLSSIRTVVAFGGEKKEADRYAVELKEARNVSIKKGFFTSLLIGGVYLILFLTYALAFWYGSTLIIACELSAGDVVTVFFAVTLGSDQLGKALPEIETFATAIGSATVVYEIIDNEPEIDWTSDEGETPDHLEGNIEFSDVTFHYPARPEALILKGLDLKVKKGQTVALVGPSGCGKSTVIQLIQRFYNPDAGQITIDGREIQNLNLKWLRSNVGIVSQEPALFNTTILENIRFSCENATLEEVKLAAKNANAHDFISRLPQGYDTDVGERGAQLSGGQKQRIAIARALVRDPKILLLDEATSALDTESEKIVQGALDKVKEGRTTIIIAHRLSTIQTADIIIAIESGRVVESGTHSELMEKEGLYHELVTAQTIAEEEESSTEPLLEFKARVRRDTILHSRRPSESHEKVSKRAKTVHVSSASGRPRRLSRRQSEYIVSFGESRHSFETDSPWSPNGRRYTIHQQTPLSHQEGRRLSRHQSGSLDPPELESKLDFLRKASIFSNTDFGGNLSAPSPSTTFSSPFPTQHSIRKKRSYKPSESSVPEDPEEMVTGENKLTEEEGSVSQPSSTRQRPADSPKPEEDEKEELPKLSVLDLLRLNKPDWPFVLLGIVTSAMIGTAFPLMSILFSDVLRIFGLNDPEEIERQTLIIVGGFVGLAVGSSLIYFTASFSLSVAGERLTKRLRLKSFTAMMRQEMGWFDRDSNSTGALTTRLSSDASDVKGATGVRFGIVLQVVFGVIVATIIAFVASWELTFVMIIVLPIFAVSEFFNTKLVQGRAEENKERLEESGQTAVESIDNIRTVAGLGVEERFINKYRRLLKGPFRDNIKSALIGAAVVSISQTVIYFIFSASYYFGAYLVIEDRNTYDDLFRVFAAIVFTANSIGKASSVSSDAARAQTSAARIVSLLRRKPLIDSTSDVGIKMDTTTGEVAANTVHFNYPARPNVKVLQGLTVKVKPGQTLALVGPSGCGKSTIVSLIERFYDPMAGSVTIESTDLRDLNLKWLRSQIGIVSQEPLLFDCSIADNIRYGALFRDVADAEVIETAKAANIHKFIESLPQGYKTNVGSKGTQLSGGQKQRIAIARALVRDPKILLLDEATSALDTESEKIVQEALDKAREGRTSIVIAHRLSTIYNSDVIAVIHNGQVIESGTHSELMALGGAYHHLNTVQLEEEEEEEAFE